MKKLRKLIMRFCAIMDNKSGKASIESSFPQMEYAQIGIAVLGGKGEEYGLGDT